MNKVQIQLPGPLERDLKRIVATLDISLAELLRRGAEYMRSCHRHLLDPSAAEWTLPPAKQLGMKTVEPGSLRELANLPDFEQ